MAVENMEPCRDCGIWEQRLRRANDRCISLILRQEAMIRDGNAEGNAFEDLMQEGQRRRISAAQDLLVHQKSHMDLSLPKTYKMSALKVSQRYLGARCLRPQLRSFQRPFQPLQGGGGFVCSDGRLAFITVTHAHENCDVLEAVFDKSEITAELNNLLVSKGTNIF